MLAAVPPLNEVELPLAPTVADRDLLVAAWNATQSNKRKAQIETLLWSTAPLAERQAFKLRRLWLLSFIETSTHDLDGRLRLQGGNPFADALWARVDSGEFSARMAALRLTEARELAKQDNLSLEVALSRMLAEYDTWPKRMDTSGRLVGLRPRSSLGAKSRRMNARKTPVAAQDFWGQMRELLRDYLTKRLAGIDPIQAVRLTTEFEGDLRVMTDSWGGKIIRAKANGIDKAVVLVSQNKVSRACTILRMDPPKRGKPADLSKARSNKRKLAKQYHPDVAGAGLREQYEAVLNAYTTLEDFNAMLAAGQK